MSFFVFTCQENGRKNETTWNNLEHLELDPLNVLKDAKLLNGKKNPTSNNNITT